MFQTLASIERKISEMGKLRKAKKEAHKKNEADFLVRKNYINSSEFTEEKIDDVVDEVTTTQKVNAKTANTKRMSKAQVSKKYGNKIGFEVNTKNSFYHAKSGDIDGKFAKWADLTEWLVVSENPKKKSEIRVFFNFIEDELKTDFIKVAKKEGFEVSFN
tara:strand:+ start:560 stop:1039 length:480 start_codon:yes stop_codon:yes gene_type:complete